MKAPHKLGDALKVLRSKGFRITPQRMAILKYLISERSHPTAEQIYKKVSREYPMMSLATVYTTLEVMKKLGFVEEMGFAKESARYDTDPTPHINLVCLKCGSIEDAEAEEALTALTAHVVPTRFTILGHRFELYGYCERCRR